MSDVFIQHFVKHSTITLPRQLFSAYLRTNIRPTRIRNCTTVSITLRETSSCSSVQKLAKLHTMVKKM